MPRRTAFRLAWHPEVYAYILTGQASAGLAADAGTAGAPREPSGDPPALALAPDTPAWRAWLASASSFAFTSRTGATCTVRKESVQRGNGYWYAYRRSPRIPERQERQGRMAKRYLGRDADLTLARLEEAAGALSTSPTTPPHPSPRTAIASPTPASHAPQPPATRWGTPAPSPSPLLTTKLHVPRPGARLVSRLHVEQRLRRGLERPLTLLAAPAGFGKSAALRAWAGHTITREPDGPAVAWVALDAGDNDPPRFWSYLLAALERAQPGVAAGALALLRTPMAPVPQPPALTSVARTLLNALASLPRDVALVLDDYHLITNPAIHGSIATLLEHPPTQLHLYLATRAEPPLPLARLRAYDLVNEIRADDLRFRPDEVAAFLDEVMAVDLPAADVMLLTERTDGWIAGIQLAGLSLRDHPDPARFIANFGGSHRHVLSYLGAEVLATQPEEVQSFLLRTALLARLCAPLCAAVTGRDDSQALLTYLEQANLFLIPLDDESRWYRYHHLFAGLLRQRLREHAASTIPDLHRRAARWLEAEGWIVEAAEHLFAIPDLEEAANLIERAAESMLARGETAPLLALLRRLPAEHLLSRPLLRLPHAALAPEAGGDAAGEPLSVREREVLRLLAQGHSNERIARELVVAVSTIKTHVHHLFAKLGAPDRLRAVVRARELGLLD